MPLRKKRKTQLLILESDNSENIILGLESLQVINNSVKEAIASNTERLNNIRKLLGGL